MHNFFINLVINENLVIWKSLCSFIWVQWLKITRKNSVICEDFTFKIIYFSLFLASVKINKNLLWKFYLGREGAKVTFLVVFCDGREWFLGKTNGINVLFHIYKSIGLYIHLELFSRGSILEELTLRAKYNVYSTYTQSPKLNRNGLRMCIHHTHTSPTNLN